MDYDYELDDESTLVKRLKLETQIRATKQGDKSILEFFEIMVRLWDQMEKLEPEELKKSSKYRKFQEDKRLIQFLLALRNDFESVKTSLLSRDPVPSLEESVCELTAEEAKLVGKSSSSLCLKGKNASVHDRDGLASKFSSSLSMKNSTLENRDEPTSSSSSSGGVNVTGNVAKVAGVSLGGTNYIGAFEEASDPSKDSSIIKILTYNVCFWNLEQQERMKAVGELIELHKPDIICFQEVTPDIYNLLKLSGWWYSYNCSVSIEEATGRIYFCMQLSRLPVKSFSRKLFRHSSMGRELCVAEIELSNNSGKNGKPLLTVATSHLESPTPDPSSDNQMNWNSEERVDQAKKSLNFLLDSEQQGDVIFCGDMNWDDQVDGPFPLPPGWVDAWAVLRPWLKGWTYDTNSNKMLVANRPLQKRLDRFMCKLKDFKLVKISMIGTEPIPGVSYLKEKRVRNRVQTLELPVLPSDHYGLLLEIHSN